MSRSIHTTRRSLRELALKKFLNPKEGAASLKEARRLLNRKRLIKRRVLEERRRPEPPLAGTPVDTIPIESSDDGPFVHHAASIEDIRAVLHALPSAATEGIARISLTLGSECMEERAGTKDGSRDPHTGRLSSEVFPGVYAGDALGTYCFDTGDIYLYAYVLDPARLPLPRLLCEAYLRLHALKTLVHEIAHHHDEIQRVRRGRWLADREASFEWYAEKMEHRWTLEVVLPYLQRAYPKETQALRRWVAHRGGLLLSLEFFAGDSRTTERNGLKRLFFATSSAFECWAAKLPGLANLHACRLAFAWELHYADQYEPCLTILDRLQNSEPDDVPALTCKADTLIHLERHAEAQACAERVLTFEPASAAAWETRGDAFEHREDWAGLLDNCTRWAGTGRLRPASARELWMHRAIAHCALGDEGGTEAAVKALLGTLRFSDTEAAKRRTWPIWKSVYRRAGKLLPDRLKSPPG